MNSFLLLATYAIALAGITYASLVVIRILKIRGIAKALLCLALFNCVQMVLAIEILSLFHAIGTWQLLILHSACAATLYACGFRAPDLFWRNLAREIPYRIASTPDRPLQVLIAAVICGGLITFILAVSVPPNNYDAMTYHMARVGYYLQHASLDSYTTANIRQTVFPANAEILILWQAVLFRNDLAAALVQWFSWCGSILAVYALARLLAFSCRNSLFAALAFACLPEVVLQSTSAQNDLVTAFFVICAFVFAGSMPGENKPIKLALVAGIAIGLALGTKTVAFLMVPGIAVYVLVFFSKTGKLSWHNILSLAGFSVVGFLLLGAYIYIQNLYLYGAWTGPEPIRELHALQTLDWHVIWSNLGRILVQFINPAGGIPYTRDMYAVVNRIYASIAEHVFVYLHISKSIPGADFFAATWSPSSAIHEDYTAYGPLFGYIALPIAFGTLLFSWRGERNSQRRALAFAAISSIALVAATLRWQHWHMRLMLGFVAIVSPLLAGVYSVKRTKTGFMWNLLLVGSCLTSLAVCIFFNQMKPLLGPNAVWGRDRTSLMCTGLPGAEKLIRIVNGMHLKGLRLGIVPANPDTFEYPLFGEHFDQHVTPIRIDRPDTSIADLSGVDCVLVYSEAQEYFLTHGKGKNQWFGKTDLHPLLASMRASGSEWVPVFDADGFGHFFVKKSLGISYNITRSLPDVMPEDTEWYGDRWVGQNFKIRVRLDPEKPTLAIRGETPALGTRPVLVISAPGIPELERIEQDKPGPFNYALSLSRLIEQRAETYVTLTFASNLVFNPKKLGQSDDSRDLSWRLMDLRLIAATPPSPRSSPIDYRILNGQWRDQWVADKLRLAVHATPGKALLVIQGIIPPEISCQELQIYVGKQAFSKREFVPGAFTWEVPLDGLISKRAGDYIDLTITSTRSFNPKKLGQSEDSRNLCWRLSNLRLVSP